MNYEQALRQLETIVAEMERGDMGIDTLCEKLKTAQQLIKQCTDRLTQTEEEVKQILNDAAK